MSLDSLPLNFPLSLLLSFSPPLLSHFFPLYPLLSSSLFPLLSSSCPPTPPTPPPFRLYYLLLPLLSLPPPLPQLAKTQFMQNQNPLDASLFYLAMKKKTLLKGLFRYVYTHSTSDA